MESRVGWLCLLLCRAVDVDGELDVGVSMTSLHQHSSNIIIGLQRLANSTDQRVCSVVEVVKLVKKVQGMVCADA